MPNKKINQLDVRTAVGSDLMLVGDPTNGTAYKSTLATLPLVPTTRTLTINGVTLDLSANRAWTIDALPSQTGNAGKYLTTDGTLASWAAIDLSGYVPTSRTLTINGVTFDLSANRSFTVSGDNIYNTSGSLSANRALTLAGFNLDFIGSSFTNRFTSAGRLLVGTTTEGTDILDVNGSAKINSGFGNILFTNQNSFQTAIHASSHLAIKSLNSIEIYNTEIGQDFHIGTNGRIHLGWSPTLGVNSQVVIGHNYSAPYPSASAILDIKSTSKGFLAPRMTAAERVAIASPAIGLLVFQTDATEGYYENTSTGWRLINSAGGSGSVTSVDMTVPTGLLVTGNPITTSGTLALAFAAGYSIPTNTKQSTWDDAYTFVGAFPTQTGNTGKYLTTNGSALSWGTIDLSGYLPIAGGTITGDLTINGVLRESITTNRQTTSYTLAVDDRGKLVEMNSASANTLTVPLNSSVAIPINSKIDVTQYGAGATTITAASGVTIRSFSSFLKLAGQYAACTLVKIGTNEWYCYGNLIA
jgi:hypothetical protein